MPPEVTTCDSKTLRLGTRASTLAQAQSGQVAEQLEYAHPGLRVELVMLTTTGDRLTETPLHELGGKGLFTRELEQALLAGEIDFAVHSLKDVPVTMPLVEQSNLCIAAVSMREDPRDALIHGKARSISHLPSGTRIGTSSLRRRAQVLAIRPDLRVENIRGNIDTRLHKQAAGEFDAIILAAAGLNRSGLFDSVTAAPIEFDQMLPAAGQGALALQCRRDDDRTRRILESLDDPETGLCVRIERDVVRALHGDCHSPIAALATISSGPCVELRLRALVAARDGKPPLIRAEARAPVADAQSALRSVMDQLTSSGAHALLGTKPL